MKKTLAAVLAAAMALSTASVAFAADTMDVEIGFVDADASESSTNAKMGKTTKYALNDISFANRSGSDSTFTTEILGEMLDEGWLRSSVAVSSGRNNFASIPVIKVVDGQPQLQFKFAHTYGTDDVEADLAIRLTATRDIYWDADLNNNNGAYTTGSEGNTLVLKKGDTLAGEKTTFKAAYDEITAYGEDMTITLAEVDNNAVVADGEELYINADSDSKVTFYFEDTAAFNTKISGAQKDVNLYYSVDEIDDIVEHYPDVDFEFISFYGAPSFTNSGSMTFNAIGAKNTTVYTFDGETLTPLDTTFDSTYGTVTAKGIKKLTTFVVADQVLEVEEEEEPDDEVTETPDVEEENPNTGAC